MYTSEDSDESYNFTEYAEGDTRFQYSCSELERKMKNDCGDLTNVKVSERIQFLQCMIQETSTPEWTNPTKRSSESTSFIPLKTDKSMKKITQLQNHNTNDIDLLLIGKTGNGKSATGNTILGFKRFESDASCTSVTQTVQYDIIGYNGRSIKVVDGPGVGDTSSIDDLEEATKLVIDKMSDAVLLNPEGYHALLLVVKYGGRFTLEDKEMIRILKAIFGSDFVKNYGILVVTCGDMFKSQQKVQKRKKFKTWCGEQHGVFQELLQECDNRAILFDNESKDEKTRHKQMKKLIETVDELQFGGRRYTNDNFKRVEETRDLLLVEVKAPVIRQETLRKIKVITDNLENISNGGGNDNLVELEELLKETDELLESINSTDKGSGILAQTLISVETVKNAVFSKLKNEKLMLNAKLEMAKKEKEIKQNFEVLSRQGKKEIENLKQEIKIEEEKRKGEQRQEEQRRRRDEAIRMQEMQKREEILKKQMEKERELVKRSFEEKRLLYDKWLANEKINAEERKKLEKEKLFLIDKTRKEMQASRDNEKQMIELNRRNQAALIKKSEEYKKASEEKMNKLMAFNEKRITEMEKAQRFAEIRAKENLEKQKAENAKQLNEMERVYKENNRRQNDTIKELTNNLCAAQNERDEAIRKNRDCINTIKVLMENEALKKKSSGCLLS